MVKSYFRRHAIMNESSGFVSFSLFEVDDLDVCGQNSRSIHTFSGVQRSVFGRMHVKAFIGLCEMQSDSDARLPSPKIPIQLRQSGGHSARENQFFTFHLTHLSRSHFRPSTLMRKSCALQTRTTTSNKSIRHSQKGFSNPSCGSHVLLPPRQFDFGMNTRSRVLWRGNCDCVNTVKPQLQCSTSQSRIRSFFGARDSSVHVAATK